MRIFVGYGYRERDRWIEELIFPLLVSFGCEPVHGKIMVGESLSEKVRTSLLECDALLGFLTRRDKKDDGTWTTHRWVIEELAAAYDQIPTVEIREGLVDPQSGMLGSQQRIDYEETQRDRFLIDIANVISVLRSDFVKRRSFKTVRLGPDKFLNDVKKLITKNSFRCEYRIRRNTVVTPPYTAEVIRIKGGLYVSLPGVIDSDLVEISTIFGDQVWHSDFEQVDAVTIQLSEG